MPLVERQHALGPYPLDPNLLSQGLPPDDRGISSRELLVPWSGRHCRRGGARRNTAGAAGAGDGQQPPTAPDAGAVPAAPSAFDANGSGVSPSRAVLHYDPSTGRYVAPSGQTYRQSDLVPVKAPKTWKDMLVMSGQ